MFHSLGPSWPARYFIFTTNYYFCLLDGNIFFRVMRCFPCINLLYHCASLCPTLQGQTPSVPENAGAAKPRSAWQHHFYLKLHIIIIDLQVWLSWYTAVEANSLGLFFIFPEMTFQSLLCPLGDQNVMFIGSFQDYIRFIKRLVDKCFLALHTVLKTLSFPR